MIFFIFLFEYGLSDHNNQNSGQNNEQNSAQNIADYVVKIQNHRVGDFEEFFKREQFAAEAFRYYKSETLFKIRGDREIIVKEDTINSILNFESCHVSRFLFFQIDKKI